MEKAYKTQSSIFFTDKIHNMGLCNEVNNIIALKQEQQEKKHWRSGGEW